jgi:hypothetical protein
MTTNARPRNPEPVQLVPDHANTVPRTDRKRGKGNGEGGNCNSGIRGGKRVGERRSKGGFSFPLLRSLAPFPQLLLPCSPFPCPYSPYFGVSLDDQITSALARYDRDDNLGALFDALKALARNSDVDLLISAAEPFQDRPEVIIPLYETVVAQRPNDARALVLLANAYWLTGRGPDLVGKLAANATSADPANRGAWHLWALAESDVRARMERWQRVAERFPEDKLARAALADNAASVAGAEHDPLALELAIRTFEGLWQEEPTPTQRRALEETLETLRAWKL